MNKKRLLESSSNVYSQNGEDGIIEKIFETIGTTSRTCIEIGAWDGFHLSNTANLWTTGWKGILIEGVKSRFEKLKNNVKDYNCICINAFVSREGNNTLDAIVGRAGIDSNVDLLSIDIDGDDYYIFKSLDLCRPRVVICEYNPTIPAEIEIFAEYGSCFGASVAALCSLAEKKAYSLVALTETNCFFVQNDLASAFAEYETRIENIKINKHLIYLATSYAGDYVVCGTAAYGISVPYNGKLFGLFSHFPIGWSLRSLVIKLHRALKAKLNNTLSVRKY